MSIRKYSLAPKPNKMTYSETESETSLSSKLSSCNFWGEHTDFQGRLGEEQQVFKQLKSHWFWKISPLSRVSCTERTTLAVPVPSSPFLPPGSCGSVGRVVQQRHPSHPGTGSVETAPAPWPWQEETDPSDSLTLSPPAAPPAPSWLQGTWTFFSTPGKSLL